VYRRGRTFRGKPAARLKTLRSEIRSAHGPAQPVIPAPENNPQSADKIKLGEALYFDPNLSSCATIATTTVTKAIAAYERTIAAFDAPYDRWLLGDDRALHAQRSF